MNNLFGHNKTYFKNLFYQLKKKKSVFLFLFITSIFLVVFRLNGKIMWLILFVILLSFIIQSIFLIEKKYSLFVFRSVFFVCFGFEIVFGLLNKKDVFNQHANFNNYIIEDPFLHYKIRPNCMNERTNLIMGEDTIYDVYYSSDKYGRRIPSSEMESDSFIHKKHAVFLGCSFTFGDGIDDNSTFPFMFQKMHSEYKSYNYGVSGYGPNQISLLFDKRVNSINQTSIPEDSGICVYTYIDDHLNRVYGSSEYLLWGSKTPDVSVEGNELIMKKRSGMLLTIAWLLNNSETMKYFKIKNTYPKTSNFYKKFADLINFMAYKYYILKPNGLFYVGLYPGNSHDTNWIVFLDKRIKILNIKAPADYQTNESYMNKKFWHPQKALNEYYINEMSNLVQY